MIPLSLKTAEWLQNEFPEALIRIRKFNVGPGDPWKFELRILGPSDANLSELRKIGTELLSDVQTIATRNRLATRHNESYQRAEI